MTKRQKDVLAIYRKSMCLITATCEKAGISRTTFYKWKETNADFAKGLQDAEEAVMDFVESKIYKAIQDGDNTMIIFYAKTKMKSRGYQETKAIQADVTTAGQALKSLTNEKLDAEIERLQKLNDDSDR